MREDKTILVLFAFALILFVITVRLKKGILLTPDEAAHLATAENVIKNTSFYIKNTNYIYNERYSTNVFRPKGMIYIPEKGMVQQYPFGLSLLLAAFGTLFYGHMEYTVPIIGAIGVILFYTLNKLYFNKEQALYAALLLMIMPGYLYWSTFTMADVPSAVLFIAGLYILEIFFRTKKTIWLMTSGLIHGFNVCVKYTNVIILPVLLLYCLIRRSEIPRFKKNMLVGCTSILIPILVLMTYHQHVYHNPFITGYHDYQTSLKSMSESNVTEQIESKPSVISVIPLNLKSIVKHALGFPLQAAVSLPYVLLGIVTTFYLIKKHKHIFYLIFTTFSILVLFNANVGGTWGSDIREMTMHSSYLRYLLLAFVLLIIPVAFFIQDFRGPKLIKVSILSILLLSSIFGNLSSVPRANLRLNRNLIQMMLVEKQDLLHNTPEQSVLLSDYVGKYLLPNRATIMPGYVPCKKMVDIVETLLRDNVHVYYEDPVRDGTKSNSFLQYVDKKLIDMNTKGKWYQVTSVLPNETEFQK